MPVHHRFDDNQVDEIPRELVELGRHLDRVPAVYRRELTETYQQVVDSVRRRRRILNLVQEALAQLRLDIKYLMFDLEMTRQERDELKAILDEMQ
ncbi:MAG: transcriptional regulator [Planctomycetaceae bacterium]|nr:transcriptional regulator [Planctomycetaceae bacterium]